MLRGIALGFIVLGVALAESPAALPSFEAASVQVHKGTDGQPNGQFLVGRVDLQDLTMRQLLTTAFNIGNGVAGKMLEGAPPWVDSVKYDIVAKADAKTPIPTLRQMLQSLLAERFGFSYHREERVMPVWALITSKAGHKLTPSTSQDPQNCGPGEGAENMNHIKCQNMTVLDLVQLLPTVAPRYFDIPVVNDTGIQGKFDFNLDWYSLGAPGTAESADIAPTTIFDVVQQLGFKLEKRKQAMPVIVIDKLDKTPTEN